MTLFSPWQWFCSTRTLSNSLETALTIVALNFWPWALAGDLNGRKIKPPTASDPATATATETVTYPSVFQTTADITEYVSLCNQEDPGLLYKASYLSLPRRYRLYPSSHQPFHMGSACFGQCHTNWSHGQHSRNNPRLSYPNSRSHFMRVSTSSRWKGQR